MFDIGGIELLIIGVIAIIVVGPKDLPGLLRRIGRMVAKMRAMAGEFKSHFDEVADREEFREIRKGLESVKDLSPGNQIKEAMSPFEDAGSSIKETIDGAGDSVPAIKSAKKKAAPAKKVAKKTAKKPAKKNQRKKAAPAKKTPRKTTAGKSPKVAEKAGA